MNSFRLVVFTLIVAGLSCVAALEDKSYWDKITQDELDEALKVKINRKRAKNVIIFIGDGMGPTTISATRIYYKGETERLEFEKFPHVGIVKTYSADKIVPDSAATANAIFTGVKVNQQTAGVDMSVKFEDCEMSLANKSRIYGVATWAQQAGKATGFITTTRVTHATPMALYAHTANRNWECDKSIPPQYRAKCKDIARQLIEDEPGRNFNVIFGGGRASLVSGLTPKPKPFDVYVCYREDGLNLINRWSQLREAVNQTYAVVYNETGLRRVDTNRTEYLLGLFDDDMMAWDNERNASDSPSLSHLTQVAIDVLKKNKDGYFLMVESGLVDMAHHKGLARHALQEAVALDDAVKTARELTSEEDTLIIVTADHSHALSFNGYPSRGEGVLGVAGTADLDNVPYTSLLYSSGGNYDFEIRNDTVYRRDPTLNDTKSYDYRQQTAVRNTEAQHGGTDVLIYASGPMSHLFHSLHEQSYIARVVSYAARIGPHQKNSGRMTTGGVLVVLFCNLLVVFIVRR